MCVIYYLTSRSQSTNVQTDFFLTMHANRHYIAYPSGDGPLLLKDSLLVPFRVGAHGSFRCVFSVTYE